MAVDGGPSTGIQVFTGAEMVDKTAVGRYVEAGDGCEPTSWVSDTVVLCERPGVNEPPPPNLVDITGKAKPVAAVPPNSRINTGFVADPRTGRIAFLSTLGTTTALYRADANRPSDQPLKVTELEDTTSPSHIVSLISLTS